MRKPLPILLLTLISLQSCQIISFMPSEHRNSPPVVIELSEDCRVSSTGSVWMNIAGIIKSDFISAGARIEYMDRLIYVDPLLVDDTTKADYIFISHNHADHFRMPDIEKLAGPSTWIIGPETVTKKIADYQALTATLDDDHDFGDISFQAVASYNTRGGLHKHSDKYLGYIIHCGNQRLYFAGDTDFIPEMENFKNLDIVFVPIGERKTAMTPNSAAAAVNVMKPRIAVPVHFQLGDNEALQFRDSVDKAIQVQFLHK